MVRKRGSAPLAGAAPGGLWSHEAWKGAARARRKQADAVIAQSQAELSRLVAGDEPVIAGPWLGEVGYELLGWIPFLRRVLGEHPGLRERMIVVSRGNTASWYADLGVQYEEALRYTTLEEIHAIRGLEAPLATSGKSFERSPVEVHVAQVIASALGLDRWVQLDPSWYLGTMLVLRAHGSWSRIDDLCELAPIAAPPSGVALPDAFVAVRFYASDVLPASSAMRRTAQQVIDLIRAEYHVIDLDPRLQIDDHEGFRLEGVESLAELAGTVLPEENLALQTGVLARALSFVGTYGGGAYLAPLLGVPAVSLFAQPGIVRRHYFAGSMEGFADGRFGEWHAMRLTHDGSSAPAIARLVCDLARHRSDASQ